MVKLIEKGTCIWIYEIEDAFGRQLPEMEIVLGEDILKSDDDYMNINGNMFVTERDVEDAIIDYMCSNYPEVHDYMCDLDGE
jgi:hypothetical protein